ncbi:general amino-acid permease gap1 [Phlyctema vagabunda]|uniref:General amino-acid permease gap1 n=1 Tax=Phlyctema vagabunda TaxID=108571 RepID=A0ABR4PE34_9HELO
MTNVRRDMNQSTRGGETRPISRFSIGDEETGEPRNMLHRKLKARHIQMIAIGGNIGTGLFVGSGKALHTGGPLALIIGFFMVSIAVTLMMQCLGEMSVIFPIQFTRYASKFIDPSLGFAVGWQYWLCWISIFGAESSAFVILVNYWNNDARFTPLWISIFIMLNLIIHFAPVRVFGEVEFIVSSIKIITVVFFLVVVWAIMGGAGPTGQKHGSEYWHLTGLDNGLHNGFKGLAAVFVTAAFAAGGTETIGVVVGEAQHPGYNLPRAVRTLMWRIFIFYVVSMLFLTFVVRYNSESLVGGSNANSSPFVLAVREAGITGIPDFLNAIIMLCVVSVGSTSIYTSSRVLKSLAEEGFAFSVFKKTDKHGRPYVALAFSASIGVVLCYLNCSSTGAIVFGWFTSISGLAFFIAWSVIIVCNWRFHAALAVQNDDTLNRRFAFRAMGWPYFPILGFVLIMFMVVCQLVVSISPIEGKVSARTFFANFLCVPLFLILWAGYKLVYKTEIIPLDKIDLLTDRRPEDPEEIEMLERHYNLSFWRRAVSYCHF